MYFKDIKIETVVHHFFLPVEEKEFFTAENNSMEFIRSGHLQLHRARDGAVIELKAPAFFWMQKDQGYFFTPGRENPPGRYIEHIYLDFRGERSYRMIASLDKLYPGGMFVPRLPEEVNSTFSQILRLYRIDPATHLPQIGMLLEKLMFTAYDSAESPLPGKRDAYDLDKIAEVLRSDPFKEYDFHKMAKELGLSMDHFRRLFREKHEMTPLEYLHYQRMFRAAELLEKTDQQIKEIVYSCNFKSDMDFSRNFKKYSGLSPRNYRKKYRS